MKVEKKKDMKYTLVVALLALGAFLLLLAIMPNASAHPIVNVNQAYNSTNIPEFGFGNVTTIQAGINAVDPCGTVYVAPGTYVEAIYTVGKSLKLVAPLGATIQLPAGGSHDVYVAEEPGNKYEYLVGLFGGTYNGVTDTIEGTGTITVEMSGFTLMQTKASCNSTMVYYSMPKCQQ